MINKASRSPHETSNPDVGCVRYARTRFLFKQPQSQRRVGMCCPRTPFRLPEKVQAAFSRAGRAARIRRRRLPRRQTDGAAGRTARPQKGRCPAFRRPRQPNPAADYRVQTRYIGTADPHPRLRRRRQSSGNRLPIRPEEMLLNLKFKMVL